MSARALISRIVVLGIMLWTFDQIYQATTYSGDITSHADILDNLRLAEKDADIIYFGESSNFTSHPDDEDKRSISEFVGDYYPSLQVRAVEKGALHAAIYKTLIQQIEEESRVKTVIVTLNLRSFSIDWMNSELEPLLQKSNFMMQDYPPLFKRFVLATHFNDDPSEKERLLRVSELWKEDKIDWPFEFKYDNIYDWDLGMAEGGWLKEDGSWDMEKIVLGTQFIKQYGFQIKLDNPRIADFDALVETCRNRGLNVVLNLMAENIERADELLGEPLVFLMKSNRDLLVKRYSKSGVLVVDNLEMVEDFMFTDRDFPTEHYNEQGRKIVARNVADALRSVYPNKFVEPAN